MPQAVTALSPIRQRAFLKILFTFFIMLLSSLSMFYNTKLECLLQHCTLIRVKYTRKGQILDLHQEIAPFHENVVSEI